jgi:hypothetical protein
MDYSVGPGKSLTFFYSVVPYLKEDVSVVPGGSGLTGVNHLANMDYSACVRMEAGYCGIRWSQYPGIKYPSSRSLYSTALFHTR